MVLAKSIAFTHYTPFVDVDRGTEGQKQEACQQG